MTKSIKIIQERVMKKRNNYQKEKNELIEKIKTYENFVGPKDIKKNYNDEQRNYYENKSKILGLTREIKHCEKIIKELSVEKASTK